MKGKRMDIELSGFIGKLEQNTRKGNGVMNFYEFDEPYYALIKARDEEEATKEYISLVAGDEEDFEVFAEECNTIPNHIAIAKFSRANGEDGKLIPFKEVVEQLENRHAEVLLMDSSLI